MVLIVAFGLKLKCESHLNWKIEIEKRKEKKLKIEKKKSLTRPCADFLPWPIPLPPFLHRMGPVTVTPEPLLHPRTDKDIVWSHRTASPPTLKIPHALMDISHQRMGPMSVLSPTSESSRTPPIKSHRTGH